MLSNNRRAFGLTAALALSLSACGDTDQLSPNTDPDPATQKSGDEVGQTEGDAETEAPEEAAGQETDADDATENQEGGAEQGAAEEQVDVEEGSEDKSWQYIAEFDEPVVWEEAGLRLSITGIGINDATSPEVPEEVSEFIEEGVQSVVVLEMTASNDSGQAVDFYPEQGRIQLLREEAEADLLFSDGIGGFEWPNGVDNDGQVFWMLNRTSFSDAVDAGELTFRANGAVASETFDQLTEDLELQITWG